MGRRVKLPRRVVEAEGPVQSAEASRCKRPWSQKIRTEASRLVAYGCLMISRCISVSIPCVATAKKVMILSWVSGVNEPSARLAAGTRPKGQEKLLKICCSCCLRRLDNDDQCSGCSGLFLVS